MQTSKKGRRKNKKISKDAQTSLQLPPHIVEEINQTHRKLVGAVPLDFFQFFAGLLEDESIFQQSLRINKLVGMIRNSSSTVTEFSQLDSLQSCQYMAVGSAVLHLLFENKCSGPLVEGLVHALNYFPKGSIQSQLLSATEKCLVQMREDPQDWHLFLTDSIVCELEEAKEISSQLLLNVLSYYSWKLDSISKTFQNCQGETSLQDLAVQCEDCLKRLLKILQTSSAAIESHISRIFSNPTIPDTASDLSVFKSLFQTLLSLLKNTICPKECTFGSALSVCKLLKNANTIVKGQSSSERAQEIAFLFADVDWKLKETSASGINFLVSPLQFQKEFPQYPDLSRSFCFHGVLLSFPSELLIAPIQLNESKQGTLLLDVLFPVVKNICISAVDRYSRLFAAQSFQECVSIIENILAGMTSIPNQFDAFQVNKFLDSFFDNSLDVVWRNWEDRFDPIAEQMKHIFKITLQIFDTTCRIYGGSGPKLQYIRENLLRDLATKLVDTDWHKKAKYTLLGLMFDRIGPVEFLKLRPDFLFQMFKHMLDPSICNGASEFIEVYIKYLKVNPTVSNESWITPLIEALCIPSNESKGFIKGLVTHALPTVLANSPESLPLLLERICEKQKEQPQSANNLKALLSLLKVSRKMRLVDSHDFQQLIEGTFIGESSLIELIEGALANQDEDLSLDALDLICATSKETEEPSDLEIRMFKTFVHYNLKSNRASFRQECSVRVSKFLFRLRESARKKHTQMKSLAKSASKQGQNEKELVETSSEFQFVMKIVNLISWVNERLMKSLYPGSPFPREHLSLHMFKCLIEIWGSPLTRAFNDPPFSLNLFSKSNTLTLLQGLWNRFDSTRELVFNILEMFPSPLPGFEDENSLIYFVRCGLEQILSPRTRECEGGALLFVITLKKYIQPWNCSVAGLQDGRVVLANNLSSTEGASLHFFQQILSLLQDQVSSAHLDIEKASREGPMHGAIMTLRYLLHSMNFGDSSVTLSLQKWKTFLTSLFEAVNQTIDVTLRIVADIAPEGYEGASTGSYDCSTNTDYMGPRGQLITVMSWLSIKEISLLFGTLVKVIPLPASLDDKESLLSVEQIRWMGDTFLKILLSTRHVGAIEKTYQGFQILCDHLLRSKIAALYQLPRQWLDSLLSSVKNNKAITRRSAGLPYSFRAVLQAEVMQHNHVKWLIPQLMPVLIQIASQPPQPSSDFPTLESDSYQPQVHAINVLRSIFADKELCVEVEQYLVPVIKLVVEGYKSPSWAVRNSATMAFTTLVQRSIGGPQAENMGNTSRMGSKLTGTTFKEFFGKFPELHPYLLKHLRFCTDPSNQQLSGDQGVLQTSTYAVLLLLANLYPANTDPLDPEDPQNSLSTGPFREIVKRSTLNANYMVRQVAARALVPLISSAELPQFLTQLLSQIPDDSSEASVVGHNLIHSNLLQILEVLQGHILHNLLSDQALHDIHNNILPRFQSKLWLMTSPCKALGQLTWKIIENFVAAGSPLLKEGAQLAALNLFKMEWAETASVQMMRAAANANATSVLARQLLQLDVDILVANFSRLEVILRLLEHPDYEVKKCILKNLIPWAQKNPQSSDTLEIQSLVLTQILSETHHACLKRMLKLLQKLGNLPAELLLQSGQRISYFVLWQRLSPLLKSPARTEIIVFLGFFLKQLFDQDIEPEKLSDRLEVAKTWVDLMVELGSAEQVLDLRRAVAKSISSFGLKCRAVENLSPDILVQGWLMTVQLLQDEDDQIRAEMAKFASGALIYPGQLKSATNLSQIQEQIFAHLTQNFSNSPSYNDYLLEHLFSDELDEVEDSARKLFEKEEDNTFEEEVILIQLTSFHLRAILNQNSRTANHELQQRLSQQMGTSLSQVARFLRQLHQPQEPENVWTIHPTYRQVHFLPIYRLLMGLVALTFSGKLPAPLLNSLPELAQVFEKLKNNLHPLISAPCKYLLGESSALASELSLFFLVQQ